jgi:cell wall-associated NlpC family hydrolase
LRRLIDAVNQKTETTRLRAASKYTFAKWNWPSHSLIFQVFTAVTICVFAAKMSPLLKSSAKQTTNSDRPLEILIMIRAFPRMLCFCLFATLLIHSSLTAEAQVSSNVFLRVANGEHAKAPRMPEVGAGDFTRLVAPTFRYDLLPPPVIAPSDAASLLQNAITERLGVRYRYHGADDRGYDCSGFVWSVFREVGSDFERSPARALWRQLPEAVGAETRQFGTLVFFNGLKHIGIVRDAESFYHASRSRGVTISRFSGYWERRVTGFRRAPAQIFPLPPDLIRADSIRTDSIRPIRSGRVNINFCLTP